MVVRSDNKQDVEPEGYFRSLRAFGMSLRTVLESALHTLRRNLLRRDRVRGAIALAFLECFHPGEILTRALRQIIQSEGMDAGAFYWKEKADELITLACHEGFISEPTGDVASTAPGEGLAGRVYASGEPVGGALHSFSRGEAHPWVSLGFQSFVGLPACSGDRILGVLVLLSRRPQTFSRLTLKRLQATACLLGEGLQKARVGKDMEDALLAVRRLSRLSQELDAPGKNLDELAQAACEAALALSSMIVLLDAQGRPVRRASFGYGRTAAVAAPRTDAVSARCLGTGESVALSTPSQVRETIGEEVMESGVASCICLPLQVGEKSLGTLWLNYESPRSFSELEIEQLQGLTNRVAAAIENTHRQALTLRRLTRQKELLVHLGRIASCETVKESLQALSDAARELLVAKTALAAFSRGERSEQAVSVARHGDRGQETMFSPPQSPEIAAIRERALRLTHPAGSETSEADGKKVHRGHGLLARRLLDEGNISLGLLIVADKTGEADFSEEDAELVDILGIHGSAAIQNAVKRENAGAAAGQYRALLDDAPVAIATLDKNQILTSVNRAFEQLSGFTREELEEKIPLFDLLPEMEREGAADGASGTPDNAAIVQEAEVLLVTKASGQKKVKLFIGAAHNSGSATICLTGVSPRAQPQAEATPQMSVVSAWASSVLAALKQPLAAATEQLHSLARQEPAESLKESLETTDKQMRTCCAAIEGLIVLGETEAMADELLPLNDLVTSVVDEKAVSLRRDGIGVVLRLDASLSLIRGDAARLRWALEGLLESSCQMPRDIQRDQTVTIQTERIVPVGRLSIHITPTAIPAEKLATLFATPSADEEDLLLKLRFAACARVMERHDWRLRAEPTGEGGIALVIEFPLPAEGRDVETQPGPASVEPPPEQVPEGPAQKRILVADDERVVVDLLDYFLRSEGHTVDISRDGRAALKRLKEMDYDLILCDIRMPEVTGQELLQWIETNKPHLADRVVFITGDVATPETLAFLNNPPKRWLEKPFDLTELRAAISRVLMHSSE